MDSTPTPTGHARRAKLLTVVAGAALVAALVLLAVGLYGPSAMTLTLFVGVGLLATGEWREARAQTPRPDDGESEGGGGEPRRPQEPDSPTGGVEFDFEQFATQFWAHVEQLERVAA